jgi:DNA-directed RNA polymerase omega subunit
MGEVSLEKLLPHTNYSVYRLVRLASQRALELEDGRPCIVERTAIDKVTTLALKEIAAGKVGLKNSSEKKAMVNQESQEKLEAA